MVDTTFEPRELTVQVGTTVTRWPRSSDRRPRAGETTQAS